ncbi:MAG TPA: MFS transporter, partial [Candidatus Dormibacteraeota bacterium]|nr:MFS transporter [Candidatus Dormibacteraeota bacterium]
MTATTRTGLGGDARRLFAARVAMSAARVLAAIVVPIDLAQHGFGPVALGELFVVVGGVSALLSVGVGLLADRVGRKPFLVGLPILTAVAAGLFPFSHSPVPVFLLAAVGSFGRGSGAGAGVVGPYYPAEQALLSDIASPGRRTALFGIMSSGAALGALLGSLAAVGLPLVARTHGGGPTPTEVAFLGIGLAALVAGLVVLPIRDRRPPPRRPGSRRRVLSRTGRRLVARLWLTNGINGVAVGLFAPFVTYWFYRRFGAGPAAIGQLYAAINLVSILSNLSAARIARRLGTVRAIFVARLLQGALLVPMALAPTFWAAGAIYLVRMLVQRVGLP